MDSKGDLKIYLNPDRLSSAGARYGPSTSKTDGKPVTGGSIFGTRCARHVVSIADALELKAFATVDNLKLQAGDSVNYIGPRLDMPKRLIVSTIGKNGYIYFRRTSKYCRPWDIRVICRPRQGHPLA